MPATLPQTERIVSRLSDREIPVGQTWWTWWFILPLVMALAFGLMAAFLWIEQSRAAFYLTVIAGIHVSIAIVALVAILRSRRWLTIRPDGFRLRDVNGTREYFDEQVVALADHRYTRFASGQPIGDIRRVTLWLTGPPAHEFPLTLRRFLGVDEPDVLSLLIERLKCHVHQNARRELGRQLTVSGENWELSSSELTFHRRQETFAIPLLEVRTFDRLEGKLRIWTNGEKRPRVEVPLAHRNTWLLEELLQERLQQSPDTARFPDPAPNSPDGPLGRILAERTPSRLTAYTIYALGFFASGVAVACCVVALLARSLFPAVVGVAIGFPGAMIISLGRRLSRSAFRVYEEGLEKRGVAGQQLLRYDEIDVLVFEARRQYSYGRYVGTLYALTLASRSHPQRGIFYTESTRREDLVLLSVRDRAARQIAQRMARVYARGGPVTWTPELVLAGEAIVYQSRSRPRLWRRSETLRIPFREILDYEVEGDWFHVWTISEERAVVKVATASPNFYAGLILLEKLCPLRDDGTGVLFPSESN